MRDGGPAENTFGVGSVDDFGADVNFFSGERGESAKEFVLSFGLEEIALGANAEGAAKNLGGFVQGDKKNFDVGLGFVNDAGRLQAVEAGHRDIHDDDVGFELGSEANSGDPIVGFAAKFPSGRRIQDGLDTSADEYMVVDDENSRHDAGPYPDFFRAPSNERTPGRQTRTNACPVPYASMI